MGSVGLGVCEGGAPGRSELGLLCRSEVAGRGSLWGAWEPSLGAPTLIPPSHTPLAPVPPCYTCSPGGILPTPPSCCIQLIPLTGDLHPQTWLLLCRCLNGGDPTIPQARLETGPPLPSRPAPKSWPPVPDSSHPQPLAHGPGAPIPHTDSQVSLPCPPQLHPLPWPVSFQVDVPSVAGAETVTLPSVRRFHPQAAVQSEPAAPLLRASVKLH